MNEKITIRARPMLATLVAEPFDRAHWVFEEKYDGDRILAYKEGTSVRLFSRNAIERTSRFPKIVEALRGLRAKSVLLDGEVVVFDKRGISRFQLLQQGHGNPVFAVFDCLYRNGIDLRRQALSMRHAILKSTLVTSRDLRLVRRLSGSGTKAFREARRRGFEGVIGKDLSSPYVAGRSRYWLKVKIHKEDEFVIVGYTKPGGGRKYFGALLLAVYDRGKLLYVGKVGTGFNSNSLASLYRKLEALVSDRVKLHGGPRGTNIVLVRPVFVGQISYQELTADNKLRQPVFLGLREDKRARDIRLPVPKL